LINITGLEIRTVKHNC